MTDLTWVQEHAAAYLAGGLSVADAAKFDALVREQSECAAALADVKRLDAAISAAFADAGPRPDLEMRAVERIRGIVPRRQLLSRWPVKVGVGLAASVGLAFVGYTAAEGGLPEVAGVYRESTGQTQLRAWESVVDGVRLETSVGQWRATPASPPVDRGLSREYATKAPGGKDPAPNAWMDGDIKPDAGLDSTMRVAEVNRLTELNLNARFVPHFAEKAPAPPDGGGPGGPPGMPGQPAGASPPPPPGVAGGDTFFFFNPSDAKPPTVLLSVVPPNGKPGALNKLYANPNFGTPAPPGRVPESGKPAADDFIRIIQPPSKPEPAPAPATTPAPQQRKIIIRSGDIEFEIESFDSAVAAVTKLVVGIPGGYVGTVNSEKLANGKVKGSVVVRVPPESLDTLVLDLRKELGKGGELKGQRIGSQDVTKQYTDLESRLKAARTMETRLLKIIQDGKGEIKQLLEAEKELGVWRTKIEEFEGELRYFSNLASLSTLTITLMEKDIKVAATLTETERVQAGVEVEDVDKAYQQALAAINELKGRISKAEVKQLAAGQFNAAIVFEVPPESSGPMRDRLRQIGRVNRQEIDRVTTAEGGTPPPKTAPVKKGDAAFSVQLYNVANIAPRESVSMQVFAEKVPDAFTAIRDAVTKVNGRLLNAQLNEQNKQAVTGRIDFEVKRADEAALRAAIDAAGEATGRTATRAADSDAVTDSKVRYTLTLIGTAQQQPRETTTLTVEVADVDTTAAAFTAHVTEAKGRVVDSRTNRDRAGTMTAHLVYEVPLATAGGLVEQFKRAGQPRAHDSTRNPQAPDGRFAVARIDVTVSNVEQIVPNDDGIGPQVRKGLSVSAGVLLKSVTWVIVGLCVVLPWAIVLYGGYRLIRRLTRTPPVAAAVSPPAQPG